LILSRALHDDADPPVLGCTFPPGVEWHEMLNIGDSTGVFLLVEPK